MQKIKAFHLPHHFPQHSGGIKQNSRISAKPPAQTSYYYFHVHTVTVVPGFDKLSKSSPLTKPLNNHRSPMLTLALKHCFRGPKLNAAFIHISFGTLRALMDLLPTAGAPEGPLGEQSVELMVTFPSLDVDKWCTAPLLQPKMQVNNGKGRAKLKDPVCFSKSCTSEEVTLK